MFTLFCLISFASAALVTYDPSEKSFALYQSGKHYSGSEYLAHVYERIPSVDNCFDLCKSFSSIASFQYSTTGECNCLVVLPSDNIIDDTYTDIYGLQECKKINAGESYCDGEYNIISTKQNVVECAEECRSTFGCEGFIFSPTLFFDNCRISTTCTQDQAQTSGDHWEPHFAAPCPRIVLNEVCKKCKCAKTSVRFYDVKSPEDCVIIAQDMGLSKFSFDPERDICSPVKPEDCTNTVDKTNYPWSIYLFHELDIVNTTTASAGETTDSPQFIASTTGSQYDQEFVRSDNSTMIYLILGAVLLLFAIVLCFICYQFPLRETEPKELEKNETADVELGEKSRPSITVGEIERINTQCVRTNTETTMCSEEGSVSELSYISVSVTLEGSSLVSFPDITDEKEVSRFEVVASELNLNTNFDSISFNLAIQMLGLNHTEKEISDMWKEWESLEKNCENPASQLEILVKLLEEPMVYESAF